VNLAPSAGSKGDDADASANADADADADGGVEVSSEAGGADDTPRADPSPTPPATAAAAASGREKDDDEEEDDERAGDIFEEDGGGSKGAKGNGKSTKWEWKRDLFEIVRNIAGLRKLLASKASTAAIGNWGILSGVGRLAEWGALGTCMKADLFMGKKRLKKQNVAVPLSKKDDAVAVQGQWDALKGMHSHPNCALVFHLKNHYALIFATREWVAPCSNGVGGAPVHVRQLLCARRGQRPAAWIDFDEARETMLGWEGYKIISVVRTEAVDEEAVRAGKASLADQVIWM